MGNTVSSSQYSCIFILGSYIAVHLLLFFLSRSNQSILKEISPEYSLEGLMLKLKL